MIDSDEDLPLPICSLKKEVDRYELILVKKVLLKPGTFEAAAHRLDIRLQP